MLIRMVGLPVREGAQSPRFIQRPCDSSAGASAPACISGCSTAGTSRRGARPSPRSIRYCGRAGFANEGRTGDQHDAFSIAAWLSRADNDGSLAALLNPDLSPPERTLAQVEGWILGVSGLIRAAQAVHNVPEDLQAAGRPQVGISRLKRKGRSIPG
jgi:hypothetical protein